MRTVDYGLQYSGSGEESDEIKAKAEHFVETAKHHSATVYIVPSPCRYIHYVAISKDLELEIYLNDERDLHSMATIEELNPIKVNKIYSQTMPYQRKYSIVEKLNHDNDTAQCLKCGRSTIAYPWMKYCSFCGEKIGAEAVKFCATCKDNNIYSTHYLYCPTCGDKLLEHPDKYMGLDFETEDLLKGIEIKSEYMDYDQMVLQSQVDAQD